MAAALVVRRRAAVLRPTAAPGGATGSGGTRPAGGFTPQSLPAGVTAAQYQAAQQACRSKLPTGGFGGGGQFNSPAFAAYRNCLQLHGFTQPSIRSPGSSTTATTAPAAATTTISPANRQAALQACASLRPAAGGAGGAASTTTTS